MYIPQLQDVSAVYRALTAGCVPHAPPSPPSPWLALWIDAQLHLASEGGLKGAGALAGALATLAAWDDHLAGPQEVAVALGACGKRACGKPPALPAAPHAPASATAALRAHQQAMAERAMAVVQSHSATLGMAPRADVQMQAAFAARMAAVDAALRPACGVSPGGRPRRGARGPPPRYLVDQVVFLTPAEESQLRGLSVFGVGC